MKVSSSFFAILALAVALVDASGDHHARSGPDHHALAARAQNAPRSNAKRCAARSPPKAATTSSSATHTTTSSSSSHAAAQTPKVNQANAAPAPAAAADAVKGLLNVKSDCGDIGATKEITAISGPNGNIGWLNCGINDGGWRPPYVKVDEIITVDLSDALKDPKTPFGPCKEYVPLFEKYGKQFNIPPILMAAFAMQESTCNPNTVGGAGEQGLMQITKDKCGAAPGGNCKDVDYNIKTGTKFFSDTLNSNNGDLLKSLGYWNGWFPSMTVGQALAAATSGCCRCQQNLDYLHQFLNGWVLNVDAYDHSPRIGKFFNLDKCGN